MNGLFYTILNMSISASILVLVVLLLRLILKKAPKWVSVLLWALVAVRLICPFAIESPFSLMPDMDHLVVREAGSYVDMGFDNVPDNILEYVIGGNQFGDEAVAHPSPTDPVTQINRGVNTQLILNIVWLSGVAVMLTYMIVSCIFVYRRIQKSTQFRDNIYTSYAVTSPFVFGIVKPCIYLPESMDAVSMSYVIAHEEAHLYRRDHWWKPLGFILLAVHWFNPIIWLAYILLCRDIEMACDERVVRDMGERERVDYSEALLDCSVDRRMITACPLAFGENNVKERIRTVLNYKKPAFWIVILAVIACAVAAICFLTNPQKNAENTIHNLILYDTETKQEMYLYEYEENKGVAVFKSAQIDLDNDRVFEEVLWLRRVNDENYGFLIVNYANDKAYAHELVYRAFMELKDDGTFSFSNGVSDHGVGRITFTGDTYTINKLAYCESNPDTQNISYYIEGEGVSKQEFDSYLDLQSKKPNVRVTGWVEAYANPDTEPAGENNNPNDAPQQNGTNIAVNVNDHVSVPKPVLDYAIEVVNDHIAEYNEYGISQEEITGTTYTITDARIAAIQLVEEHPEWLGENEYIYKMEFWLKPSETDETKIFLSGEMIFEHDWFKIRNRHFLMHCDSSSGTEIWTPRGVIDTQRVYEGAESIGKQTLTLDDVIRLSAKGGTLTWEDFASYACTDVGYGLFIFKYPIDDVFHLRIGDSKLHGTPMYIRLSLENTDFYVDVTKGDVTKFIETATFIISHFITEEDILSLFERYLLHEQYTVYSSSSIDYDQDVITQYNSHYYNRVTDERFDTWEEWTAFVGSIFCGDYLNTIMENEEKFINLDGKTYVVVGDMGWLLSRTYTYEVLESDWESAKVSITRRQITPGAEDSEFTAVYQLIRTDGGWRIEGRIQ